jgi:hypothetical protein
MPAALYPQVYSWYPFLLEVESAPDHSAAGRIRSLKESSDFIGNRTHNLLAWSTVPQPTMLLRASVPHFLQIEINITYGFENH